MSSTLSTCIIQEYTIRYILLTLVFIAGVLGTSCNRDVFSQMQAVNTYVNRSITYKSDGIDTDYWQYPEETLQKHTGDCEDYAILKAALLHTDGIIHIVQVDAQTYHAILEIDGLYLDNRFKDILSEEKKQQIYGATIISASVSAWMQRKRGSVTAQ